MSAQVVPPSSDWKTVPEPLLATPEPPTRIMLEFLGFAATTLSKKHWGEPPAGLQYAGAFVSFVQLAPPSVDLKTPSSVLLLLAPFETPAKSVGGLPGNSARAMRPIEVAAGSVLGDVPSSVVQLVPPFVET